MSFSAIARGPALVLQVAQAFTKDTKPINALLMGSLLTTLSRYQSATKIALEHIYMYMYLTSLCTSRTGPGGNTIDVISSTVQVTRST